MKARQKGVGFPTLGKQCKDIHAQNPNPLLLHAYLNKPTATQPVEANQIKQGIIQSVNLSSMS